MSRTRFRRPVSTPLALSVATIDAVARPQIEVTGVGTAEAVPDRVDLTLVLEARAPKINAALGQLAEAAVRLAGLLDRARVPAGERQTSQLQLTPMHDQYHNGVTGHLASQATTVRLGDVSQVGPMLEAASQLELAATLQVGGLRWVSTRAPQARREARRLAVEDALARAGELAAAAGLVLGDVRSMTEGEDFQHLPPPGRMRLYSAAGARAMPVEAGSLDFTVSVRLVMDIFGTAREGPRGEHR